MQQQIKHRKDDTIPEKGCCALCFTLNNYTEEDIIFLSKQIELKYNYIVIGQEIGESNTPHLQGYVEFKGRKTLGGLKKIHNSISWRMRIGTAKQASDYCKKGEQSHNEWNTQGIKGPNFGLNAKFIEIGEISKQGNRTDLTKIIEDIKTGKTTINNIVLEKPHLYDQYGRTLEKAKECLIFGNNESRLKLGITTKIIWLYGETGIGKDTFAWEYPEINNDESKIWKYPIGKNLGAMHNYQRQPFTLMSDFRGVNMSFDELLQFADKWPLDFERKYCSERIQFISKIIFITSPYTPWEVYRRRNKKDDIKQLLRRIVSIKTRNNLTEDWVEVKKENGWWINPRPEPINEQDEFFEATKQYNPIPL